MESPSAATDLPLFFSRNAFTSGIGARVSAVSIQPGSTELTWMLSLAQAQPSAFASWTMPPLVAA